MNEMNNDLNSKMNNGTGAVPDRNGEAGLNPETDCEILVDAAGEDPVNQMDDGSVDIPDSRRKRRRPSGIRGRSRRFRIIVAVIAVAVIVSAVLLLTRGGQEYVYAAYDVMHGSVKKSLAFDGTAQVRDKKLVYAKFNSKVRTIFVKEGERIEIGSKLAMLENGKLISSDMSGYVGKINVIEQENVNEKTCMFELYNLTRMTGEFDVSEYDIPSLAIGHLCTVTIPGGNKLFLTRITSINMNANHEGGLAIYKVGVDLNGLDGVSLLPGMQLHMSVDTETIDDCSYILAEAISFDEGNSPFVYVKNQNRYEELYITVDLYNGEYAAVKHGLENQSVVYAPYYAETDQSSFLAGL